jgi:DNA-binding Xre family transcriptional regulator
MAVVDGRARRPITTVAMDGAVGLSWTLDVVAIEKACILHGWSRRQLSARAHIDPETLSSLLTHRRRPHLGTVRAICEALDLPFDHVILFT